MKRPLVTALFLFGVAGLAGCPIYDHSNAGCYVDSDCARNYVCDTHTGDCVFPNNYSCAAPGDCDSTSTCTPAGTCEPGDCSFYDGCVNGYHCDSSSGVWACVANNGGNAGAAGGSGTSGTAGASDQGGQGGAAGQGGQSSAAAGVQDVAGGAAGAD
ncbi:MAG TPA: hypothetical protein VGM44_10980 [Polyangiaceae bacterium]|jgi:hypothetical protein